MEETGPGELGERSGEENPEIRIYHNYMGKQQISHYPEYCSTNNCVSTLIRHTSNIVRKGSLLEVTHLIECVVTFSLADLSHYLLTACWIWFLQL